MFFKIPGTLVEKLQNEKMFPLIIFLSIVFVGSLIQITRVDFEGATNAFGTSVATRFSSYHLYALLLFLFLIFEIKIRIFQVAMLFISIFFYSFNLVKNYNNLKNDQQNIYIDAYNFKYANESTFYVVDKNQVKNIIDSGIMTLPNFKDFIHLKSIDEFSVKEKKIENEYTYLSTDRSFDANIAKIYLENNMSILVHFSNEGNNKSTIKLLSKFASKHQILKIEVLK